MARRRLSVEEILEILNVPPSRIAEATEGLTAAQLRTSPNPDEGEWSARDVLAHLRSCSDVWGDCIAVILAEDGPTIRAVNPKTWIKKTDYREQEFGPSLQVFTRQRSELLEVLEPLAPEQWKREATVTGAGKPLIRSVHTYAQWLARHERSHVRQIERIVQAVGG